MASNRKPAKTLQSHNVLVIIKLVMYTSCSISRANFDCYILNIIVVNCCIVMCGITVYNTIFFILILALISGGNDCKTRGWKEGTRKGIGTTQGPHS